MNPPDVSFRAVDEGVSGLQVGFGSLEALPIEGLREALRAIHHLDKRAALARFEIAFKAARWLAR